MSFLGSIVSKILHPLGGSSDAKAADAAPKPDAATAAGADVSSASGGTTTNYGNTPSFNPDPATTGALPSSVDVSAVMSDLAAKNADKHLNWKTSIVDLLKLIGVDSSLHARQELAKELNYTGDINDSASMNTWLHKQVLQKLADNGGKVPADLLS